MTEHRTDTLISDEDAFELLPWYATGKTTPEETQAIDRKLAASPRLQAELAAVRREQEVSRAGAEAIGQPPAELFDRIMAQVGTARQLPPIARDGRETASDATAGFLARLFGFLPAPALRLALVAACLVVVVEGAALVHLSGSGDTTYGTASGPDAAAGPQLIVRFQPDTKFSAVNMLLSDLDAGIVKGPMPDGAYVIALPPGTDVDGTMTILRGHGDIVAGVDRGS